MTPRARAATVAALACTWLAGCGGDDPAQVIITLDAQDGVQREATKLEVIVTGASRPEDLGDATPERRVTERAEGESTLVWPRVFALAPDGGDASRVFRFHAIASDGGGQLVAETRLVRGYDRGRVVQVRLVLSDRCRGIACEDGFRCEDGECVPETEKPPELDGGVGDAGPPIPCATDVECNDGVFCNGTETCLGGRCAIAPRIDCDDGVACTVDRCGAGGCLSTPDSTLCTAGAGGRCDPVLGCQYSSCTPATCAADASRCETAACVMEVCMRGSLCGAGTECCAGTCDAPGCDDGNPCTTDYCGGSGCVHEDNAGPCDDGNPCTHSDACRFRVCAGTPVLCDDGNDCTMDECNGTASCGHVPITGGFCDDGNFCSSFDNCVMGMCQGTVSCNDGVACTDDTCGMLGCEHVANDMRCTAMPGGTCDETLGCQYPTCTSATCAPSPGVCETAICMGTSCVRTPISCDDSNPCTNDTCTGGTCGHTHNTLPCDDGSACTTGDRCSAGTCRGTGSVSCDDGNECTIDSCSGGSCSHLNRPTGTVCNDESACTTNDRCRSGGACRGDLISCGDGNPCTADSCDPATGCRNMPLSGTYCEDGDFCSEGDMCDAGSCVPGPVCPGPGRYCDGRVCIDMPGL